MPAPKIRSAARPWCVLVLLLLVFSTGACASGGGGAGSAAAGLPEATMVSGNRGLDLGSTGEEINISIEVMVDSAGNPDLRTLRVTGQGAVQSQSAVAAWIQSARFRPARVGGRPVAGVFRTRIRSSIETRRIS